MAGKRHRPNFHNEHAPFRGSPDGKRLPLIARQQAIGSPLLIIGPARPLFFFIDDHRTETVDLFLFLFTCCGDIVFDIDDLIITNVFQEKVHFIL
jgi:hypothetical protein